MGGRVECFAIAWTIDCFAIAETIDRAPLWGKSGGKGKCDGDGNFKRTHLVINLEGGSECPQGLKPVILEAV
jgi:hypothetical protein